MIKIQILDYSKGYLNNDSYIELLRLIIVTKSTQPEPSALESSSPPDCEMSLVHLDTLRQGCSELLSTSKAQQVADLFGLLSDSNRLRLLLALASQELCVRDLAAVLSMSMSVVSHQLRTLRINRLVSYREVKHNVYYRLDCNHVMHLLHEAVAHLEEPDT